MAYLQELPRRCLQVSGAAAAGMRWLPVAVLRLLQPPTRRPGLHLCVQEQRGERLLVRAALALVALQAACTWATWSAAMQQAQKLRQE